MKPSLLDHLPLHHHSRLVIHSTSLSTFIVSFRQLGIWPLSFGVKPGQYATRLQPFCIGPSHHHCSIWSFSRLICNHSPHTDKVCHVQHQFSSPDPAPRGKLSCRIRPCMQNLRQCFAELPKALINKQASASPQRLSPLETWRLRGAVTRSVTTVCMERRSH